MRLIQFLKRPSKLTEHLTSMTYQRIFKAMTLVFQGSLIGRRGVLDHISEL